MKFILFFMIVYGSPDSSLYTIIKGPSFNKLQECKDVGEQFGFNSQLPILKIEFTCEKETQT